MYFAALQNLANDHTVVSPIRTGTHVITPCIPSPPPRTPSPAPDPMEMGNDSDIDEEGLLNGAWDIYTMARDTAFCPIGVALDPWSEKRET